MRSVVTCSVFNGFNVGMGTVYVHSSRESLHTRFRRCVLVCRSKIEEIIKEVGDLDIIGFGTDYLDAIINESVKDNMGVDFSKPVERKSNKKQVEDIPQEKQDDQDEERNYIESGMQQARTMICPHCGKEIVI